MPITSCPLVLITGSNQGIGLATAQILASKHSYHVIVAARNLEAIEKVAAQIRDAGGEATALHLDLSSPTSIEAAVATIDRDFGYLDVLINNAGVQLDTKGIKSTWDLYTQTFFPNVFGTGVLTDALVPLLRKAKSGPPRIVFLSTIMGSLEVSTDKTLPWHNIDYKVYDSSKAALNMLMINYARILEDAGGKVNSVCPGLVKSNLTRYIEYGTTAEVGAEHVVAMATVGEDGPTGTFSNTAGKIAW